MLRTGRSSPHGVDAEADGQHRPPSAGPLSVGGVPLRIEVAAVHLDVLRHRGLELLDVLGLHDMAVLFG